MRRQSSGQCQVSLYRITHRCASLPPRLVDLLHLRHYDGARSGHEDLGKGAVQQVMEELDMREGEYISCREHRPDHTLATEICPLCYLLRD